MTRPAHPAQCFFARAVWQGADYRCQNSPQRTTLRFRLKAQRSSHDTGTQAEQAQHYSGDD